MNRRFLGMIVALTSTALTACGGGSSGSSGPNPAAQPPGVVAVGGTAPSPTPTPAHGATPAPTATPTHGATPAPTASPTHGATPAPTPTATPGPTDTPPPTITRLGSYHVAPSKIFVAGISSGGFFAVQMHFAHSAVFKGAAIYAGGVDHCAQDSVELALAECGGETVNGQALYVSTLSQSESYVEQQSNAGTIDSTSHMAGQPVYLWSGTHDEVVNPKEMRDLTTEYEQFGAHVMFQNAFPANHGWESPDGEVPCGTAASPYMIACEYEGKPYDSEAAWLKVLLGSLQPRNNGPLQGSLMRFDQTEFGAAASNSMDTSGTVFVPKACAAGAQCGFILALHGCLQTHAVIGDKFVTEAGLDEWADTNDLIVLYPYAVAAPGPTPYNPNGCWDWWGYDDPNYALKSGTQMTIVYKMVQRVTGAP